VCGTQGDKGPIDRELQDKTEERWSHSWMIIEAKLSRMNSTLHSENQWPDWDSSIWGLCWSSLCPTFVVCSLVVGVPLTLYVWGAGITGRHRSPESSETSHKSQLDFTQHLNCQNRRRQLHSSSGRQNRMLKLMRQCVLSGFWPLEQMQQRKEEKIWIIGMEGLMTNTFACVSTESLPFLWPIWVFSYS
jgi:hypothetical protein